VEQFEAGDFMAKMAAIEALVNLLEMGTVQCRTVNGYMGNVALMLRSCESLGLKGSLTQAHRAIVSWQQNQPQPELRQHLKDLLSRIRDDMFGTCFYYVQANKTEFLIQDPIPPSLASPNQIRIKFPYEYFGREITKCFPAIHTDLQEALKCYAFELLPACVFHLMRATEIGIPKVAKLCEINDRNPSWGPVLEKAEKLTQKTKFDDLPGKLKPHIEFLRLVVADMRSLQRAWRDKIMHVEDRLILSSAEIDLKDTHEIFVATRSFLRRLADGLPE